MRRLTWLSLSGWGNEPFAREEEQQKVPNDYGCAGPRRSKPGSDQSKHDCSVKEGRRKQRGFWTVRPFLIPYKPNTRRDNK